MHNCSAYCNVRYLRTPMGAVKVVNVVFGVISLILVGASYVPVWTLGVFVGTVASCLFLSLLYMTFYLLASPVVLQSKANRVTSFLYHVLAGTALVVAGIELIGWSEYRDPSCKHDCPRLYTVGIAKTLTFMNGVLYMIVGFLGVKDDDLLDPDAADEDIPLLNSTSLLNSIPGNLRGSQSHFYDSYYRHHKPPYDDVRSNYIYRLHRPSLNPNQAAEYSFNNSYASMTCHNTGAKTIAGGSINGRHHRDRSASISESARNVPNSMPNGNNMTDLHFIKE